MPPFGVRCAAVVAATVLLLGPALALAADRALVISNPATLPDDQAAFVAAAHRELVESYVAAGYETTEGIDLRRDEFARILGLFEGSARSADRIVIHFVGAAVSVSEATGLIPVGASVDTRTAAVFETVPLSLLMDIAALRPNASVVALAIPPYPPTEAAGFANASHLYQVPEGVLVVRGEARAVFAVVTEQMLSQALPINRIPDAGNGVRFEGAVTSSLSLGPAPGSDAASISASTSAQDDDSDLVEQALWELANRSQNPAIAEAYLQRYPAGRFADEARALAERAPENQTPEARETSLDLSATARRRIQQDLTDLGFDTRGVDGVFGPGTRQAIRAWQRSANFSPTGYLTRRPITVMERDAVARSADLREQALRVEQEERQADTSYWRETGATGQEADLRRYLDRYPKGIYSARARDDLEQLRLRAEHEKLELELRWQYHGPGTVFLDLGREPDFAKPLYSRETSDHRLELKLGTGLYHWRLRARDADGRLLETGETRSFRVLAVDPPRLVGPVGGERVELQGDRRPVDFHWRFARPGDTHFRVEVSRKRDFSEVARAKTTTNDTITLPLGEGRYWWRVIASGPDQSDGAASPPALFNLGTARQLARIGVTVRTPRGGRTIDPFNRGGIRFYWKASPVFDRFKIEMFHYNGRLGRRVFKLNTTRRDILFDRVARLKPGSYRWVVTAYQQDGLTMSDHGDFNIMLPPRPRPPVSSSPETQIQVAPSFDEPRGRRTPPDFSGAPRSRIAPPGESEAEIIRRIPSTGSDRP